jgi:hypothetical protein
MFDIKNLTRLKKLDENAPETMKAFWAFDKEAFKGMKYSLRTKTLRTANACRQNSPTRRPI